MQSNEHDAFEGGGQVHERVHSGRIVNPKPVPQLVLLIESVEHIEGNARLGLNVREMNFSLTLQWEVEPWRYLHEGDGREVTSSQHHAGLALAHEQHVSHPLGLPWGLQSSRSHWRRSSSGPSQTEWPFPWTEASHARRLCWDTLPFEKPRLSLCAQQEDIELSWMEHGSTDPAPGDSCAARAERLDGEVATLCLPV